uniref:Fibronectin type-III domain-containing protein n=1 Tax=Alexandrium catenella TaxID=2925 RepID=A0A7S1QC13_ALECA
MRSLRGNTAYMFRVWAVSEAGPGPSADIGGRTGPVAPGTCGTLRSLGGEVLRSEAPIYVEWGPPADTGGAPIVAYRLRLRPLYSDSIGDSYPADTWIDLGLTEHRGEPTEPQRASVQRDKLPASSGCLCSVAALNAAGCTGPPTKELAVFFESQSPETRQTWDYSPGSGIPWRGAEDYSMDSGPSQHGAEHWVVEPGSSLPYAESCGPPLSPEPTGPAPPFSFLGSAQGTSYAPDGASGYGSQEHVEASRRDRDGDDCAGAPGICGTPRAVAGDTLRGEAPLYVEWRPPADVGGFVTVVAYRLSLRPLFYNGLGNACPGESSIDLGLTVHQGGPEDVQSTYVQCDRLPPCPGCLCSVSALDAAGMTGPPTREVPVFFVDGQASEPRSLWELGSPDSGGSQRTGADDRVSEYVADAGGRKPHLDPMAGNPIVPGHLLREQVFFAHQKGLMQAEPDSELPPPRRAAPMLSAGEASSGGSFGEASNDLYAQAVRALHRPRAAGGGPADHANGAPGPVTPQHRINRNSSIQSNAHLHAQLSRMASGPTGGVHVQTLQDVGAKPQGGAGLPRWSEAATFGMGSRGALVAGRPKPAG